MLGYRSPALLSLIALLTMPIGTAAQSVRARDLGVPLPGETGPLNAITDVAGVEVGHATLVEGSGALHVGVGPVRTGVTAILPRGKRFAPVFAGWYALNGNGEMTGTTWVAESGFLEGPVMITNTHSVGVVRDAVLEWMRDRRVYEDLGGGVWWGLPVVAETYDGILNDINGFHVQKSHVFHALGEAASGPVAEGNVGGGTGMVCHRFKGGIGTSSRRVGDHTLGVLVQCNYGGRSGLTVAGVPVGAEMTDLMPEFHGAGPSGDAGSIIVVVATDAPLLPHQLERLARRVPMGIARVGGIGGNGSGDIFMAFSTANEGAWDRQAATTVQMLSNDRMSPLFQATVEATEEAILNALVGAETMEGINGNRVHAIPHGRLQEVLERFGRLQR